MCVYVSIYIIYMCVCVCIAEIQQQLKWHRDDLWAYRTTKGQWETRLVQNQSTRGTRGSQSVATSSTIKHLSQTARKRYPSF